MTAFASSKGMGDLNGPAAAERTAAVSGCRSRDGSRVPQPTHSAVPPAATSARATESRVVRPGLMARRPGELEAFLLPRHLPRVQPQALAPGGYTQAIGQSTARTGRASTGRRKG